MSCEPSFSLGGPVRSFRIALRISGDDLEPDALSKLLGLTPTVSYRAGDMISPRVQKPRKKGAWIMDQTPEPGETLEVAIQRLLATLQIRQREWHNVVGRFSVDFYCAFDVDAVNAGFELNPNLLSSLGKLGISLGIEYWHIEE